jgi:hypothetical protein
MSETAREFAANYRKPPLHARFKKGQSGNPRGRPVKNLAALLAAALNEKVTVTENGKRRKVTKREAVIAQLVNKSASAELRATKMLIEMLREIERKTDPAPAEKNPFGPSDKEVVRQLITRLRRNVCHGCPRAAQQDVPADEASPFNPSPAPRERGDPARRAGWVRAISHGNRCAAQPQNNDDTGRSA